MRDRTGQTPNPHPDGGSTKDRAADRRPAPFPEPDGWVSLTAGCKINLGLAITGTRADGYHTIDSIFYPLPSPSDTLLVRETVEQGIRVETETPGIDCAHNTLTKAWEVFRDTMGTAPGIRVRLVKGIPWGAGLGGGSSDAACLLRHLAALSGKQVEEGLLAAMAAKVGADVPFFLKEGPMRVTGIGDRLAPCNPSLPGTELVLVTPGIAVSTPWAYRAYDANLSAKRANTPNLEGKILTREKDADKHSSLLCTPGSAFANDLETVVFPRYPELASIKRSLLDFGAAAASMSGSGSSVFGLFRDEQAAALAAAGLSGSWSVHHMRLKHWDVAKR